VAEGQAAEKAAALEAAAVAEAAERAERAERTSTRSPAKRITRYSSSFPTTNVPGVGNEPHDDMYDELADRMANPPKKTAKR